MKYKLLLGCCFLNIYVLLSQCPTSQSDFTFSSQQQIDDFLTNYLGCTDTTFNLIISGNDITNVDGLNGLNSFNAIIVKDNPLLTNLDGLSSVTSYNLESSFFFLFENNPLLNSLSGLSNGSTNQPIDVNVVNNPSLLNLDGLQGMGPTGYNINIINNNGLSDFTGLSGFELIEDLYIENNSNLFSFNGLANLTTLGTLYLINNDTMSSFSDLNAVNPLCGFVIKDNDNLSDIDGFQDMYEFSCGARVTIENNPLLSVCNSLWLCDATPMLDVFEVSNNASGCDSVFEITDICQIPPFNDSLSCTSYLSFPELSLGNTLDVSNTYSTLSNLAPSCNDSPDRKDIWFWLNFNSDITVDLQVSDGYFLQLWEGQCGEPTQVSNSCGAGILENVMLTANTNYYAQVWSNNSDSGRRAVGPFEITLREAGTLSNNNFDHHDLAVYPNPFKDFIKFNKDLALNEAYIYDISGKLIEIKPLSVNSHLDLSSYQSGLYFLSVSDEESSTHMFKIIKQ
ncbi:T9SS type A sorting domain-containing protein [Winogradskyella maritima]|uniref:T9SS type A sorting domain-containing protein n=1 Tax=Winogradskyella maritima TaxID=1517766 RepID=A0ABV8AM91_9FLAO|nr:T9SS type A sorting domain-containing protein [Winogradskyella maritima]